MESIVTVLGSFTLLCFFFNRLIYSGLAFGAPILICSLQALTCEHEHIFQPNYHTNEVIDEIQWMRNYYLQISSNASKGDKQKQQQQNKKLKKKKENYPASQQKPQMNKHSLKYEI